MMKKKNTNTKNKKEEIIKMMNEKNQEITFVREEAVMV